MSPVPASQIQTPFNVSPIDQLVDIEHFLAGRGLTVLDLVPAGNEYSPGGQQEVWDRNSHSLWFFHRHPDEPRFPGEAGHFHTFLGAAGMPRGTEPFVLPEMALATSNVPEQRDPVTHLSRRHQGRFGHIVGISVDARGRPIGLFTTNRWVTGEIWYRALDVVGMIERFHLDSAATDAENDAGNLGPVNVWLMGVLALLQPHIAELLHRRDETVMDWRRRRSRQRHVFDDRRLEIPSIMPIDFDQELARFSGYAARP